VGFEVTSPSAINNIRQFIAFRVFFNARFYYPVFTILFLDFGLTLRQFALLNAAWAATIVLFEVPSGALADILGRRNLLVSAGVLMVVEMALLCFVPRDSLNVVFVVFLINRVLSGVAEAAASGADEALAYDTLKKEGMADAWGGVLEKQMRVQSMVRIGAMILGAVVYDPDLMQRIADAVGLKIILTQDITLRFPLYLTLVFAIMTLVSTLRMREVVADENLNFDRKPSLKSILQAFKLTFQAGRWILMTPFALVVIAAGLMFDGIIRMLLTMNSQYYRVIELPEASFGLISAAMGILGIFIPKVARGLAERRPPAFNLAVMAGLALCGFVGITFVLPVIGLIPAIMLSTVMYLLNFFVSYYLNLITDSHQRATVLSFKGLSYNLAYGLMGVLYSLLLVFLRYQAEAPTHELEQVIYVTSLVWFPWVFVISLAALLVFARWKLKGVVYGGRMGS
jgi:MFS family permease